MFAQRYAPHCGIVRIQPGNIAGLSRKSAKFLPVLRGNRTCQSGIKDILFHRAYVTDWPPLIMAHVCDPPVSAEVKFMETNYFNKEKSNGIKRRSFLKVVGAGALGTLAFD